MLSVQYPRRAKWVSAYPLRSCSLLGLYFCFPPQPFLQHLENVRRVPETREFDSRPPGYRGINLYTHTRKCLAMVLHMQKQRGTSRKDLQKQEFYNCKHFMVFS